MSESNDSRLQARECLRKANCGEDPAPPSSPMKNLRLMNFCPRAEGFNLTHLLSENRTWAAHDRNIR
jgi:hypothetical protein